MNVSHDALFQNCVNGSSPLKLRAARAPDMKSFKRHLLNHWSKFQITSHECFPWYPLLKLHKKFRYAEQKGPYSSRTSLNDISSWTTSPNSKIFHRIAPHDASTKIVQMVLIRWTKRLPELQIRNVFQRQILNQWSKFKIISQNCFS